MTVKDLGINLRFSSNTSMYSYYRTTAFENNRTQTYTLTIYKQKYFLEQAKKMKGKYVFNLFVHM